MLHGKNKIGYGYVCVILSGAKYNGYVQGEAYIQKRVGGVR